MFSDCLSSHACERLEEKLSGSNPRWWVYQTWRQVNTSSLARRRRSQKRNNFDHSPSKTLTPERWLRPFRPTQTLLRCEEHDSWVSVTWVDGEIAGVGKTDWKWPKPGRGKTWTLKPDPKSHSSLATQRPLASLPSWPTRTKSFPQTLPSQHHHPVSQEQVVCIIEAHPLHQGVCSLVTLNGHPCDPGEPFLTPVHLEILEYQHKSFLFRSCLQSLDWQLRVAWHLDWVWLQPRRCSKDIQNPKLDQFCHYSGDWLWSVPSRCERPKTDPGSDCLLAATQVKDNGW